MNRIHLLTVTPAEIITQEIQGTMVRLPGIIHTAITPVPGMTMAQCQGVTSKCACHLNDFLFYGVLFIYLCVCLCSWAIMFGKSD